MMRLILVSVMLVLSAAVGCGKPDCPSWTKTTDDSCIVPGGQAGQAGLAANNDPSTRLDPSTANPGPLAGTEAGGASAGGRGGAGGLPSTATAGAGGHGRGDAGGSDAGHTSSEHAGAAGMSGGSAGSAGAGGSSGSPGKAGPACGNGVVDPGETCDGNCPTSCPAAMGCNAFTLSGSSSTCTAECVMMTITITKPGDGCCPEGANAATDSDCPKSCGDGIVQPPELCEATSADKPCPTSCDDGNSCTKDTLTGSAAQCNAACVHTPITAATSGDGCCPSGANANSDSDCDPKCGNGVKEPGEACDGNCPSSCSAGSGCMREMLTGSAARCDAACVPMQITTAVNGDGCCPANANANSDNDCKPNCGNRVVEAGETCDGNCPSSCNDGNACTDDRLNGSGCSVECKSTPVPGRDCGGGRMCTSAGTCEAPPQRCGDGVVQSPEECDAGAVTWECDAACHRTRLYTACGSSSECRNGQSCIGGACTEVCTQQANGTFMCPSQAIPDRARGVVCYLEPAGDYGYCRPRCQAASDCPSGFRCTDSVCMP